MAKHDLSLKKQIQRNYTAFDQDLEPRDLIPALYERELLSENECEEIRSAVTRRDRCWLFLDKIGRRGPKTAYHFRNALSKKYSHLAQLISIDDKLDIPVNSSQTCFNSNTKVKSEYCPSDALPTSYFSAHGSFQHSPESTLPSETVPKCLFGSVEPSTSQMSNIHTDSTSLKKNPSNSTNPLKSRYDSNKLSTLNAVLSADFCDSSGTPISTVIHLDNMCSIQNDSTQNSTVTLEPVYPNCSAKALQSGQTGSKVTSLPDTLSIPMKDQIIKDSSALSESLCEGSQKLKRERDEGNDFKLIRNNVKYQKRHQFETLKNSEVTDQISEPIKRRTMAKRRTKSKSSVKSMGFLLLKKPGSFQFRDRRHERFLNRMNQHLSLLIESGRWGELSFTSQCLKMHGLHPDVTLCVNSFLAGMQLFSGDFDAAEGIINKSLELCSQTTKPNFFLASLLSFKAGIYNARPGCENLTEGYISDAMQNVDPFDFGWVTGQLYQKDAARILKIPCVGSNLEAKRCLAIASLRTAIDHFNQESFEHERLASSRYAKILLAEVLLRCGPSGETMTSCMPKDDDVKEAKNCLQNVEELSTSIPERTRVFFMKVQCHLKFRSNQTQRALEYATDGLRLAEKLSMRSEISSCKNMIETLRPLIPREMRADNDEVLYELNYLKPTDSGLDADQSNLSDDSDY